MGKKKFVLLLFIATLAAGCNCSNKKENGMMPVLADTVSSNNTEIIQTIKISNLSFDDGDQFDFLSRRFDISDTIRILDHVLLCHKDESIEVVTDSVRYILPDALQVGFVSINSDSSIILIPVVDYQNPDDFHIEGYLYAFFITSQKLERMFPLYNSVAATVDKHDNYYYVSSDTLYSVNILTKESSVLCVFDEINMCSYKICINTRGYYELVYIQDYYKDILENSPNKKAKFCLDANINLSQK